MDPKLQSALVGLIVGLGVWLNFKIQYLREDRRERKAKEARRQAVTLEAYAAWARTWTWFKEAHAKLDPAEVPSMIVRDLVEHFWMELSFPFDSVERQEWGAWAAGEARKLLALAKEGVVAAAPGEATGAFRVPPT